MFSVATAPVHRSGPCEPALTTNGRSLPALWRHFRSALPTPEWCEGADRWLLVVLAHVPRWTGLLDSCKELLERQQLEKILRHRFALDRQGLIVAYALHRMVLAAAMRRPLAEVHLTRNRMGAPEVLDCPDWHTSLSHAGAFVAIGVTGQGPIGVDIEPLTRAREMPEIAASVKAQGELQTVHEEIALLKLWVRKEALLKAEGVGLSRPMRDFHAPANTPIASISEPGTWLQLHEPDAGGQLALAVAGPARLSPRVAWLSPRPET